MRKLTIQEASDITLKLSNKGIILDNTISAPTFQDSNNIFLKKEYYCGDNIIHELCHYLVANNPEKQERNLGLDSTKSESHVLLREAEAFILQERFYKEINVEDDPEAHITKYKKYLMSHGHFGPALMGARKSDLSENLKSLLDCFHG